MDFTQWTLPDAVQFLVSKLKAGSTDYGYNLQIDNLANGMCHSLMQASRTGAPSGRDSQELKEKTAILYDAAWYLVQRGVLRLGVLYYGCQLVDGLSLSLTPFGRQWIQTASSDEFMVSDANIMQQRFAAYSDRLGPGYLQRANEAVVCFQARAYLSCCTMCGAAAESILIALASAKTDDPEQTLKDYSTSRGRKLTLDKIIGQADQSTKRIFEAFMGLLSYWRDESAHGKHSDIGADEAAISLIELLQFAMVADTRWLEFTS